MQRFCRFGRNTLVCFLVPSEFVGLELKFYPWEKVENPSEGLAMEELCTIFPAGWTWNYLKLPETTWNYLKLPETTWNYLKLPETTWNSLKLPENSYNMTQYDLIPSWNVPFFWGSNISSYIPQPKDPLVSRDFRSLLGPRAERGCHVWWRSPPEPKSDSWPAQKKPLSPLSPWRKVTEIKGHCF